MFVIYAVQVYMLARYLVDWYDRVEQDFLARHFMQRCQRFGVLWFNGFLCIVLVCCVRIFDVYVYSESEDKKFDQV